MLIRWDDEDWDLDLSDLTNRQAMAIETGLKMSIAEFYDLLDGEDGEGFDSAKPHFLKLITILYWLMLDQGGVKVAIGDVEFPVIRFAQAVVVGMAAAAAAVPGAEEPEPDPTRPAPGSAPSPERSSRSKKPRAVAGSPHG